MTDIPIIFMGTPEFAVTSLKTLLDKGYNVKAVVTTPDKPAGRGKNIQFSDVKKFALEHNLPILQPEKLKSPEFLAQLKEIDADLFVVVAFRMLPKEVWAMPKRGTINLHAALLPDYRGAAPINHAIINGETETGITTFYIDEQIDTGKIIMQERCAIEPEDNIGTLYDKLMFIGAEAVCKTVDIIASGNVNAIEQDSIRTEGLHPAPKITKEFCQINWNNKSIDIHNLIRGLSPYPAAWCYLKDDITAKIFTSAYSVEKHNLAAGTFVSDNKSFLKVATQDGFVSILELQMQGKKRMAIKDFLNGFKFNTDK
ncbi:MAG: methionyl-tRNA formyltransferase [Bacteroidales bacterium]|nr:methionyl-tRNA formyltransferase [Bacteroidales bacterium]MBQ1731680.1 methionyl-tRNA formyltransferase [Bacteroidales bacterium]MBQ2350593.1 methionyl-tRNA formyltransferase [Bacteroidales bacterium]MBQ2573745.1 methionyl-tRNA formyltransferase [Bacteroidales bacterium]MBQ5425217.1 methionyl-tRNA formyltransferase [Bacteroidales bacterium]